MTQPYCGKQYLSEQVNYWICQDGLQFTDVKSPLYSHSDILTMAPKDKVGFNEQF